MLERIRKIKNIGLFNDIQPASVRFKKLSLVYGDNGRGKSTLASIMRSYTHSEPNIIIQRKTLNSADEQAVHILFGNGNGVKFENNQWDSKFTDIHVFDLDFIDSNVYSGGEIKASQRKKLLSFALGHAAVTAMTEFNLATDFLTECMKDKKLAEANLLGYKEGLTTAKYIGLKKIEGLDDKLAVNATKQAEASKIDILKAKGKAKKMTSFDLELGVFFTILNTTAEKVNDKVEERVKEHITSLNSEGAEKWISQGQSHIKNDLCPFCSQNLNGNDLVEAYKSYFNQEYSDFIKGINKLTSLKETLLKKINCPLINQEFTTASEVFASWADSIALDSITIEFAKIQDLKNQLDDKLTGYISSKNGDLFKVFVGDEFEDCNGLIDAIKGIIEQTNNFIDVNNAAIDEYKQNLEAIDLKSLVDEKNELERIKTRYSDDVIGLISIYENAKNEEKNASQDKERKREALNQIMSATLGRYESSINSLLLKFGASFSIKEITYNYNGGGEPKTEYAIELRGKEISLQGEHSGFKTCLSEGDKRTLAFAFFVSVIMSDADLINKIVVIDDPMCSFDSHRKQQTITVLKNIYDNSKQLIVLAHDAFFIKSLRDEFYKKGVHNDMSLIKIIHTQGQFSNIDNLDVDIECESAYFKNHRLVSEYVAGVQHNDRDVATAIRPMLEGYLHRRFPKLIAPGLLFGAIVQLISNSQPGEPLYYAFSLVDELNEINVYAGKFHHDTNANAADEFIQVGELLAFCNRSLQVIYKGV
ncbi:AAA family ATPase [Klebsiella pneumoniae]